MSELALEPRWRSRLSVGLLLAPALLWLGALIVLPHIDLAVLSFVISAAFMAFEMAASRFVTHHLGSSIYG